MLGLRPVGDDHIPVTVRSVDLYLRQREGTLTDGTVHAGVGDLRVAEELQLRRCRPLKPSIFGLLRTQLHPVLLYLLVISNLSSKLAASTRGVSLRLSVHWSWKQLETLFIGYLLVKGYFIWRLFQLRCNTDCYRKSFLPSAVKQWLPLCASRETYLPTTNSLHCSQTNFSLLYAKRKKKSIETPHFQWFPAPIWTWLNEAFFSFGPQENTL